MKTTSIFGLASFFLLLGWPLSTKAQFDYSINPGGATVTITDYTGSSSTVTIPAILNGRTVTGIGEYAFSLANLDDPGLTSMVIPSTVTNIGDYAFGNCFNLTTITVSGQNPAYSSLNGALFDKEQTVLVNCPRGRSGLFAIPGTVTNIGIEAFIYCQQLGGILIPDSVTAIGYGAFTGCSLSNIFVGSNVTSIGSVAFSSCASLTNITVDAQNQFYSSLDGVLFDKSQTTLLQFPGGLAGNYAIPATVNSIADLAFASCSGLTGVTMPDSLNLIGDSVFEECYSLTNVTFGVNVTSIGTRAFGSCGSLKNAVFPSRLNYIGNGAFDGCGFNTVVVGDSVTNVGAGAFQECYSLIRATIGRSVATLGEGVFSSCDNLTNITVDAQNEFYSSLDGVLFDKSRTALIEFPGGVGGSYTVPDGVARIGDSAFDSAGNLSSVKIPASVTSLGEYALNAGPNLRSIIFMGAPPAVSINYSFGYSPNPPTIYYLFGEPGWSSTFDYLLTSLWDPPSECGYSITNGGVTITSCTALNGVTSLPAMIAGLPVTSLGAGALNGTALTSVTIPDSVTNIGATAFGNSALTTVIIPDSVLSIQAFAFNSCAALTTVTIGSGVANIGLDAFASCPNLTGVYFFGNAPAVGNPRIVIDGNSDQITVHGSFVGDGRAIVFYLPTATGWGVDYGGLPALRWNGSFHSGATVDGLEYASDNVETIVTGYDGPGGPVIVPATINGVAVTSIGQMAFEGSSITSITLPESLADIGYFAFAYCGNLTNLYFAGNAPTVGLWTFADASPTAYYLPGTAGWEGFSAHAYVETSPWLLPEPLILDQSVGVRTNQLAFIISWAASAPVVVEACADLAHPVWQAVVTNTLTDGASYFCDPRWTNYPSRFYRLRLP
ncbi:MAG TPA: leucine-rich repeat domain-containing protein [Verrucomicrobiae bacterium]|jgi:hypothetical protein